MQVFIRQRFLPINRSLSAPSSTAATPSGPRAAGGGRDPAPRPCDGPRPPTAPFWAPPAMGYSPPPLQVTRSGSHHGELPPHTQLLRATRAVSALFEAGSGARQGRAGPWGCTGLFLPELWAPGPPPSPAPGTLHVPSHRFCITPLLAAITQFLYFTPTTYPSRHRTTLTPRGTSRPLRGKCFKEI